MFARLFPRRSRKLKGAFIQFESAWFNQFAGQTNLTNRKLAALAAPVPDPWSAVPMTLTILENLEAAKRCFSHAPPQQQFRISDGNL